MTTALRWETHHLLQPNQSALQELLSACFPGYFADRTYFKQLPHTRTVIWRDEELIAHVAIDRRVVRVGEQAIFIFGLIDVCVAPSCRSQGIGAQLLDHVAALAKAAGAEHLLLFADDPRLYTRSGFYSVDTMVTWLAIDEHKTLGIRNERLADCMMVRTLGSAAWPEGDVDMLGYLF